MLHAKLIGEKIAEARKKAGLSQAQIGEHLFISPQAVGKWERGESLPDILHLNELALLFQLDIGYFVGSSSSTESDRPLIQSEPTSTTTTAQHWDMSKGNWVDADFSGLKHQHEQFSGSNIKNCTFVGAELSGLLLNGNNVEMSDFSSSNLSKSHFRHSNLNQNKYDKSSFIDATFSTSNLHRCSFDYSDLTRVVVEKSRLNQLSFDHAIFEGVRFNHSQLDELTFRGNITNCSFEGCSFYRVTFEHVVFRSTFFKNNKNLKRVKFMNCSADRLSYAFLKTGNADLTEVKLLEE